MTIPLFAAKSASDTDWDQVVTTLVSDMSNLFHGESLIQSKHIKLGYFLSNQYESNVLWHF